MHTICLAAENDKAEILALYKTMLYGPADWNEYYPNEETIDFDLSRNALFVMKNGAGEIIAAISIDKDEEVDALPCWNKNLAPGGEFSRLCIRKDMQNQGISKEMIRYVFDIFQKEGKKSAHILVKTGHEAALAAYGKVGFKTVGECNMFGKDFICMEAKL
ncbi:MAG: GNAT family N-acetyltransferase [Oscillospiraceae bacterium]